MVMKLWGHNLRKKLEKFDTNPQNNFYYCQWQPKEGVSILFLVYRWIMAILFISFMFYSIFEMGSDDDFEVSKWKWLIYFTHWGYMACVLQACLAVFIVTERYILEKKIGQENIPDDMKAIYHIYWILHSSTVVIALGITMLYWILIYDPALHKLSLINFLMHAVNSIMMLIDFFLVNHSFRILHCFWTLAIGITYIIFTVIYFLLGGTDKKGSSAIYPILNWESPGKTCLVIVFALLTVAFIYFATYGLFLLRRWIYMNVFKTKNFPPRSNKGNRHFATPIQNDIEGYSNDAMTNDNIV